jgi:small-conductance mechanosensitive channel
MMTRFLGRFALLLAFSVFLLACEAVTSVEPTPDFPGTSGGELPAATATGILDELLPTRTPVPTATPGLLARGVEEVTAEAGLSYTYVLGLSTSDWINLGISLFIVVLGYLAGTLLIRRILPPIARRTPTELDDRLVEKVGPDLRWLVVVFALQFATQRLTFIRAEPKDILSDVYFLVGLAVALQAGWRLIDLVARWYGERSVQAGREEELAPLITLLGRIFRVLLLLTGLVILLSYFGANTTAFAAALALGGLAISLAARDTIADAIAGFIILVDRPFRIGDRIEIEGEATWGDVVDIGLRTTRIRTRDNRLVVVPNSLIGQNKVSNYSYPDPSYRIETTLSVAYGTDIEVAERLIIDAVRQVPGVLAEKEIEVLYDEMGDWAMTLGIRWWLASYQDARRARDRVHRALQKALDAAGIEMPYPTQTLRLRNDLEG